LGAAIIGILADDFRNVRDRLFTGSHRAIRASCQCIWFHCGLHYDVPLRCNDPDGSAAAGSAKHLPFHPPDIRCKAVESLLAARQLGRARVKRGRSTRGCAYLLSFGSPFLALGIDQERLPVLF